MTECALILLAAFVLDLVLGDPRYPLHPVRLIGRAISSIENALRTRGCSGMLGGGLLAIGIFVLVVSCYLGLHVLLEQVHHCIALIFDIAMVYSCLALRDLLNHAKPIARSLHQNDLQEARKALQRIVGRNTETLDDFGVARAAIESVSENFIDGFFSPLCWYVIGGVCGFLFGFSSVPCAVSSILVYKVVNTLDSMVGYLKEPYQYFGRISARMDDLMNFISARLGIVVLFFAAAVCRLNALEGLRMTLRDRLKHASPNAGHSESFMAGALCLKLGGPANYPHGIIDRPWMGDGSLNATNKQILASCRIVLCAGWISVLVSVIGMMFLGQRFF